jgi:hypothetical protein
MNHTWGGNDKNISRNLSHNLTKSCKLNSPYRRANSVELELEDFSGLVRESEK